MLKSKTRHLIYDGMAIVDYKHLHRETDRDWDKELAEDVKSECESKYGRVDHIMVEKDSQVSTSYIVRGPY